MSYPPLSSFLPDQSTFGEKTSRERGLRGVLPVTLSAAKGLSVRRARPFAALRVTALSPNGCFQKPQVDALLSEVLKYILVNWSE